MNKVFNKKVLAMLLTLVMLLSLVSTGLSSVIAVDVQLAEGTADTKTVYFSVNGQWTQKLCAVFTWGDDYAEGQWLAMKNLDSAADLWTAEIPADYSNITFCSRTAPYLGWGAVKNQTGQLTIPEGCDHFTLTNETAGVWDSYKKDTDSPVGTRVVYFAPNEEWMEIQGAQGHNFALHAYNTTSDSVGAYYDMTLVQGSYGMYPTIWQAEISEAYTNVEFMRGEGTYEDGTWKLWESTFSAGIHSTYNLFTQDMDDYQTGEWSYIDAPAPTEPKPTEPTPTEPEPSDPGTTEPDVDPVETKKVYFTPNSVWATAVSQSGGFSVCSWSDASNDKTWTWLEASSGSSYSADIPATATSLFFAVSYSTEPDAVWNQTDNLTIPQDSNHFTQDSSDFTTGTWNTSSVTVSSYYVVFIDEDGTLLDAQLVKEGESATAPKEPSKSGYTFTGWDTDFSCVKANLTVKAQYKLDASSVTPATTGSLKIEVSGGTGFAISLNGGVNRPQGNSYANSKAPIGAAVKVTANEVAGKEFMGWINPANGQILTKEYTYSFTTSGNDFIKAMYKTDIDGVNSVIFKNGKAYSGNGQILDMQYYAYGDEITTPANPSQVGFDFKGWDTTEEGIQENLKNNKDTEVLATWKAQFVYVPVEIIGGTGEGTVDAQGNYVANLKMTLTADEAPEGMRFGYWTLDSKVMSYSEVCTFYPYAACKVEAVFIDEDTQPEYQAVVRINTIDTVTEEIKNIFYYSWCVPEAGMEVTYVKAGIVAMNEKFYDGTNLYVGSPESNMFDRSPEGTTANKAENTYTWTKTNVAVGDTWVAKAYVQYRTVDGTLHTVYSDLARATK